MPRKVEEMSPLAVSRLKGPGLYFVGGVSGLALQVLPTGGRTWVLRATIGGKRREMGLGGYPDVTLATARQRARDARDRIWDGVDPIAEKKAAKAALLAASAIAITFKEAAEKYIAAHEQSWKNPKHRQQWQQWPNSLAQYAYPVIGSLAVADIELPHVLKVLEPIWTDKTETASRLRGRIELVLDWATARGYRSGLNPARWRGHLDKLLARPSRIARVQHHEALAVGKLGEFMGRLRAAQGMGARALEFAILTAARSGEVRGALWSEINLKEKVWTVPGARMKAGREHRVPLSDVAISLLEALPRLQGAELVFWAPRGGQLSDMTLTAVLRRMNLNAVPHGFRSTFRDWAAERTAYSHEVCEMALAHTISNKAEAAYRRGDLFERRRQLMQDWAKFCAQPSSPEGQLIMLRPVLAGEGDVQ